jgi:hypothetical protein
MADYSIRARLKRLFSNDAVIANVGGKKLKVIDINKLQAFKNVNDNPLTDKFTKLHTQTSYRLGNLPGTSGIRFNLFGDYEQMDTDPTIAAALDIVSDECCMRNEYGDVLTIKSSDDNIKNILNNLFNDVLNIEFNLWPWTRNVIKYGDFFLHLKINEEFGIYNVVPYSPYNIIREEGYDLENPNAVRFKLDFIQNQGSSYLPHRSNDAVYFDNFEVAHFRLLADTNYLPYGRSFIEPARKTWKQLVLSEDAMLLHRIMRAPERRIFYINVGNIPPAEVDTFMNNIMDKAKKIPYQDPDTGDYNLRFNVMNMLEDYYIPVRNGDATTKIDTLKGLEYSGIDDVNYFKDRMISALKVPKSFLGYEADMSGKGSLAAQDVRFARTIEHIQKILISELRKLALIHLYVQGFSGEDLVNFDLELTIPSIIFEQEKIALWKEKVALAKDMEDSKLAPRSFIYDHIFHLSDEAKEEFEEQLIQDAKLNFRLNQIKDEGNDPETSGKTYGTPHDLATMYSNNNNRGDKPENVPAGYEDSELGRPVEKDSIIGTEKSSYGDDPIGKKTYKDINPTPTDRKVMEMLKKNSKLSIFSSTNKKKYKRNLLSEENIITD